MFSGRVLHSDGAAMLNSVSTNELINLEMTNRNFFVEANSRLSSICHALVFCFVMHANRGREFLLDFPFDLPFTKRSLTGHREQRIDMLLIQVTVLNQTVWNPDFSTLAITRTKRRFPSSAKRCNFTPDFSESPIFLTNFRFRWRFEKSGFHFTCTTNRFALQFNGEFNWKCGQIRLLCFMWAVMFIYESEV